MKILYFDCFSGISGDMTLGALIDLGVSVEDLKKELKKLNLSGYELSVNKTAKYGIAGTDVDVILTHDPHHHDHEGHEEHRHHGRNLKDIIDMIDRSELKDSVKAFGKKVFFEIAQAEAKVHHKSPEEVHFHEVGAVDSIIDIVGVAICLDLLGVKKVLSSPLHEGQGFIECQHGILPVPVPAVMEMLSGSQIPVVINDINTELVTPTGIGIIKCLASDFGNIPPMTIDRIGYGFGKKDIGRLNTLRIVLGTLLENKADLETIVSLETNIDDMSPEILGYMMEQLFENGALDVFYTPIYMKKNRPATMVTVLTKIESEQKLVDIILLESSTIGIRRNILDRYVMDRETIQVNTSLGMVKVKCSFNGKIKKYSPEYEDCKELAARTGIPIREIYENVMKNL